MGPDKYEVIIEDTTHILADQLQILENMVPYIVPGGMYIIEHLNVPEHSPNVDERLNIVATKYGLQMDIYDFGDSDKICVYTKI